MDHLNFEGGGGGGRIGLRKFFLTGQCFSFTVKALQGIFFSNRPHTPLPPGPPQKSNGPPLIINRGKQIIYFAMKETRQLVNAVNSNWVSQFCPKLHLNLENYNKDFLSTVLRSLQLKVFSN